MWSDIELCLFLTFIMTAWKRVAVNFLPSRLFLPLSPCLSLSLSLSLSPPSQQVEEEEEQLPEKREDPDGGEELTTPTTNRGEESAMPTSPPSPIEALVINDSNGKYKTFQFKQKDGLLTFRIEILWYMYIYINIVVLIDHTY